MKYKAHEIERTNYVHVSSSRKLYGVAGRFPKPASKRPFLTSLQMAKDWVSERMDPIIASNQTSFQRNEKVLYTTPISGVRWSARIATRHQSGVVTIRLLYAIHPHTECEETGGYYGSLKTVSPEKLTPWPKEETP